MCDGVPNHRQIDCLFNKLRWLDTKNAPKARIIGALRQESTVDSLTNVQ